MKAIKKVFLIIGTLVLCLVIWGAFFNGGGVMKTAWNAVVSPINETWQSITGDNDAILIPEFDATGAGTKTNGLDVDGNMGNKGGN